MKGNNFEIMTLPEGVYWWYRCTYSIGFCICLYILKKEYVNRKQLPSNISRNIYQKLLKLWSLLTMITATLACLF